MKRFVTGTTLALLVVSTGIYEAQARPEYARKESKQCGYCHTDPRGGGPRNFRGGYYGANSLSFNHFDEEREAAIAHVAANSNGDDSVSKVGYIPNVSGPAAQQIQLRANRSPVVVVFLNPTTDDTGKAAAKTLSKIADSLGRDVAIIGVVKGDTDAALKLTADLGNMIRVLPDPDGAAIEKYKAKEGWDFAVIAKTGDPVKMFSGFSAGNLGAALDELASEGITFDKPSLSDAPAKAVHGAKLSG